VRERRKGTVIGMEKDKKRFGGRNIGRKWESNRRKEEMMKEMNENKRGTEVATSKRKDNKRKEG
jgi:hypothetical protein